MKKTPSPQQGFTLIEVMVVIVIMSITVSLVVINIDSINQRKVMQARELMVLNLKKINRESKDQSRIYALAVQNATDVAPFQYAVVEYKEPRVDQNNNVQVIEQNKWQVVPDFETQTLPNRVSFSIEPVDHTFQNANNNDLTSQAAPNLIWFGNGEAKPAKIQFYYNMQPVGDAIQIDYLGKVDEKS